MFKKRTLTIVFLGSLLVLAVIWAYPKIAFGFRYARIPLTNKVYHTLYAQARLEMKKSHTNYSRGANCQVWIAGLAPRDAIKDLEVKGMGLYKRERIAMKFFTNKQRDSHYVVRLLGKPQDPDALPQLENYYKPVKLEGPEKSKSMSFWNIRAGYVSLEDNKVSHKTLSLMTALLKNVQLDPKWLPRFDRRPVYEWETFRNSICLGVFAAWLSDGFTGVEWKLNPSDLKYKPLDGLTAFNIQGE